MNHEQLKQQWLKEEENARIIGWDFSYLSGRYEEEGDLPWDYRALVLERLKKETDLLDMETGFRVIIMTTADSNDDGWVSSLLLDKQNILFRINQ